MTAHSVITNYLPSCGAIENARPIAAADSAGTALPHSGHFTRYENIEGFIVSSSPFPPSTADYDTSISPCEYVCSTWKIASPTPVFQMTVPSS